jgi:menaquinone-specific isochorismate synthase
VLSRVCEIRSDAILDAAAALGFLNAQYVESYRFLFEPTPHHAFIGATPELLVKRDDGRVTTMALAGSIGRGRDPEQDRALAAELMASPKERLEHRLVVTAVRDNLGDALDNVELPAAPVVLRLPNIQHLLTPIAGTLNNSATSLISLVRRLHPTPALGGAPAAEALTFLSAYEPVPRGWYAGPVGWVDPCGDGAFVVAIRSAVTQHDRAWLYAGAGIVGESQPEREWAETALKFRPMLGALGADGAKQDGSELQSQ